MVVSMRYNVMQPTFPVHLYPLVKSQRDIIRKHTEAVYHLAWDNAGSLFCSKRSARVPCNINEFSNQSIIKCFVNMPEKHVCLGVPFLVKSVLTIVAENGVVGKYDLTFIVL